MLKVAPSPPVPQVSMAPVDRSGRPRLRIARAKPTISSSASPRTAIAASSPPICAGVASPSMMAPMASPASSSLRRWPATTRPRWRFKVALMAAGRPGAVG